MALPRNLVYVQGVNVIDDSGLNTFVQWCPTAAALRTFPGITDMSVLLQGIASVDDDLGGFFFWNPTAEGPDDNLNTIVPYGVTQGAWVRLDLEGPGGGGGVVTFTSDVCFRFDGGGAVPPPGVLGYGDTDWAGTITGWKLTGNTAGAMEIDVWKKPFAANSPPTDANSITASSPPILTSGNQSATGAPTGWTTAVAAGDQWGFNLVSISTITSFTLSIAVSRTIPVT